MASTSAVEFSPAVSAELERHRHALTGYCYRMLGSSFEAEDAVQESFLRAWRAAETFEGRSALKSWLYKIATNVCLDMLSARKRRARPMDLGPAGGVDSALDTLPEAEWLEPVPTGRVVPEDGDPADIAQSRETLRLAFVAALQQLPPRQRAVLILRDVLRWQAAETAGLLETSVASVNSALQRARATLDKSSATADSPVEPIDGDQQELLERYVEAFEQYDVNSLIRLPREDATLSMPPYTLWLQGSQDISAWLLGRGCGCRGSRLIAVDANGSPGFGQYRPSANGDGHEPWALQVVDTTGGRISRINSFLDTQRFFPLFGLPSRLGSDAVR